MSTSTVRSNTRSTGAATAITATLLLLLATVQSCVGPSNYRLPGPELELNGLKLNIHGITDLHLAQLSGEATNISGRDLGIVQVWFDVVDSSDVKIGDAVASTVSLKAGASWKFTAHCGSLWMDRNWPSKGYKWEIARVVTLPESKIGH